jgi:hypothetical protein
VVDFKLLKKEDMFKPETFQTIQLFEPDTCSEWKMLSLDLVWQYKIPAELCCNNAKSCYDQVVHSVASLCFQQQGIEEPLVVCMFLTLQNLEHTMTIVMWGLNGISPSLSHGIPRKHGAIVDPSITNHSVNSLAAIACISRMPCNLTDCPQINR